MHCGKVIGLPFRCNFCGGLFCPEHRLPENHACPNLPPETFIVDWSIGERIKYGYVKEEASSTIVLPVRERRFSLEWEYVRKLLCLVGMVIVPLCYVTMLKFIAIIDVQNEIIKIVMVLFVVCTSHELMHALAWWYYGCWAIPIPILIPPFLGITIGPKLDKFKKRAAVSLAPILITLANVLLYLSARDGSYLVGALINLLGMGYDFFSLIER